MRSATVTFAALFLCAAAMALVAAVEERELVRERRATAADLEALRRMRENQFMLFGKRHTFVKREEDESFLPEADKRHTFVKRGELDDSESDSAQEEALDKRHTFVKRHTFIKRHTFV